jgi:hypothetical protein
MALHGMGLLGIPVKKDFSRPHRLCRIRFSSVEITRRAEIHAVIRNAEARREMYISNVCQTNPIQVVFSAPGGGKSRFLDLLADSVGGIGESCLRGSVVLPISYIGVMGTPSSVDEWAGTNHSFGLAARILWSHFAESGAKASQFSGFVLHMQAAAPMMNHFEAVEAVMKHQGTDRVLLLVDDLFKADKVAEEWPVRILASIGQLLDNYAGFNAVVTTPKPSLILWQQRVWGRRAQWVPLAAFTLQESLMIMQPALEKHSHLGKGELLKMLVSDVGGHPRGLEVLVRALDKHLQPGMGSAEIVNAVVAEFSMFSSGAGTLSLEVVQVALRGMLAELSKPVGSTTVEGLIASGVLLNSEVNTHMFRIVARLSIMLLRVFCSGYASGMMNPAKVDLVKCIKKTALQIDPHFEWDDMKLFHAHCEVLMRLLGCTERTSLDEFYFRDNDLKASKAIREVSIEFCNKTDGVIAQTDKRSIFHGFTDHPMIPICSAVYMARSGQAGFDMVTFEEKSGGGHVAIFVDTKYSAPEATTTLPVGSEEARQKWAHCLAWREESEAARIMGIGPEDCFLVMASWRCSQIVDIQETEAMDDDSHILVLGRRELTRFYTPTLVSRAHLIAGQDLVLVEGASTGGDGMRSQAELRHPTP